MSSIYSIERLNKIKKISCATLTLSILIGILSNDIPVEAKSLEFISTEDYSDLKNDNFFEFHLNKENNSFDWIENYPNIEELVIYIETVSDVEIRKLKSISKLKYLDKLTIYTRENVSITNEAFGFLKDCNLLRSLIIDGPSIEEGILESITQLRYLSLNLFNHVFNNVDTDFNKLLFLEELNFKESAPYNIPMWVDSKSYNFLRKNGVLISSDIPGTIEILEKVNDKLDAIVCSLNIEDSESDKEKLDKILIYVMESLEYDKEIASIDLSEENWPVEKARKFYENGFLYGALEKDSAICGNYAALFMALCRRCNIKSYCLCNSKHAWNMVEIEGKNYFADSTCLDCSSLTINKRGFFSNKVEEISMLDVIEGKIENELEMYLSSPLESMSKNDMYVAKNFPSYINTESLATLSKGDYFDIFSDIMKVVCGEEAFIIFLVYLRRLAVKRKKKRERIFDKCMEEIYNGRFVLDDNKQYVKKYE